MAAPRFNALSCVLLLAACTLAAASDATEKPEHVHVLGADFDDNVNDGSVWFIKVSRHLPGRSVCGRHSVRGAT